jgi:DNA-binding transcriptional ArsR family regulator
VGEIVIATGADQPSVSKHLKVLRKVGLVRVRRSGRHKFYRANADGIRPLYDFSKTFERYWSHQLLRVKERAEARERAEADSAGSGTTSGTKSNTKSGEEQ